MTLLINDITPRIQYTAAAAQTTFPYPFPIFEDEDMVVDIDGVVQTLTTHYTVSGEGETGGGDVVLVTPASGGEIVTLYRDVPVERTTDFQQNGEFRSRVVNLELDRIVAMIQQIERDLGRSFKVTITSANPGEVSPLPDTVIGYDENNEIKLFPVNSGVLSSTIKTPVQIATAGQTVFTVPEITTQTADNAVAVVNGAVIRSGYTPTAGQVEFDSGLSEDDEVWFLLQFTTPIGTTTAGAVTDTTRGQSVQSTLDVIVRSFETVADAVAAKHVLGDYVKIKERGGAEFEYVASGLGNGYDSIPVTGGGFLQYRPNGDGAINLKALGAKFDYDPVAKTGTDDTEYFNAAYDYLRFRTTDPAGGTAHGWGVIELPKGNTLVNGEIFKSSPIGMTIKGQGAQATAIHRTNDAGILFKLRTFLYLNFEDFSIIHQPTDPDRENWTNICFDFDGTGGGRQVEFNRINTVRFGEVFHHSNVVNEASVTGRSCSFQHCRTFLNSENAQAVVNNWDMCIWDGEIKETFLVAGSAQTHISNGNCIDDGVFIRYKNIAGKYGVLGFTLTNTKFEWIPGIHDVAGSAPRIIDAQGDNVQANVSMRDCSLNGGVSVGSLAADARWASLNGGIVRVRVEGGELQGGLEIGNSTRHLVERGGYIKLNNVEFDPRKITLINNGAAGRVYPNIELTDVPYFGLNPVNVTLARGNAVPYLNPRRKVTLGDPETAQSRLFSAQSRIIEMPVFGQRCYVWSVHLCVRLGNTPPVFPAWTTATPYTIGDRVVSNGNIYEAATTGTSGATAPSHTSGTVSDGGVDWEYKTINGRAISVYDDEARTNLIGSLVLPSETHANKIYQVTLTDNVFTEGLYFDMRNPLEADTFDFTVHVDFMSF